MCDLKQAFGVNLSHVHQDKIDVFVLSRSVVADDDKLPKVTLNRLKL